MEENIKDYHSRWDLLVLAGTLETLLESTSQTWSNLFQDKVYQ